MTDLYVNTDTGNNSWDGTSATYVSGTTGPKATLAGAEAVLPATFTDDITIHCTGATADTAAVGISGMTIGAPYRLYIVGDATSGIWDETKYHLVVTGSIGIDCTENYVDVSQLQIKIIAGATTGLAAIKFTNQTASDNAHVIDRCILWGTSDGTQGSFRGVTDFDVDTILMIRNSTIYGFKANVDGHGVYVSGEVGVENCTIQDCTRGLVCGSGTLTATNCAVFNNVDDLYNVSASYCAIDDADSFPGKVDISPGATEATDWAAAFTDYVNADFRVKDINSVLYDAAIDLSGSFTTDIAGTTRNAWDIGAFELAGVSSRFSRPGSDRTGSTFGAIQVHTPGPGRHRILC
jgi:hypothetical protein